MGSDKHKPHFEFGGPVGAIAIAIGLPAVTYGLYFLCHADGCLSLSARWPFVHLPPWFHGPIFTLKALVVIVGWLLFQAVLHAAVPGTIKEGVVLPNGQRLPYKINALLCAAVTAAIVVPLQQAGYISLSYLYTDYLPLTTAALIVALALSVAVYAASFLPPAEGFGDARGGRLLAAGGNTGNVIYDWFIGRELNLRLFGWFDVKYFCELRPGLIGWCMLDIGMCFAQYERYGFVSVELLCVTFFQVTYVLDALLNEPAILTTMDITTDGFGFMLAFGDLAWLPFVYSFQARYLVDHLVNVPWWGVIALFIINFGALAIFRGANNQKNAFRNNPQDPAVKHLKFITTSTGSALLTSGWWGIARHVNYLGDWLQSWAFCLPTGFQNPITYFYVLYFGTLLVHRELRDEEKCRKKYGADWDRYCSLVPWRIIPFVF